jgi:hypothetical protein
MSLQELIETKEGLTIGSSPTKWIAAFSLHFYEKNWFVFFVICFFVAFCSRRRRRRHCCCRLGFWLLFESQQWGE